VAGTTARAAAATVQRTRLLIRIVTHSIPEFSARGVWPCRSLDMEAN
jgi:hypothetical protein